MFIKHKKKYFGCIIIFQQLYNRDNIFTIIQLHEKKLRNAYINII